MLFRCLPSSINSIRLMVWEELSFEDIQDGQCWPSWISEQNDFSNSKPPCGPNAIHQVWAQSDLGFWSRCGFKIFKMATQAAILVSGTNYFSNSESLCRSNASHQVSAQSKVTVWEKMSFEEFQDGPHGGHLGYRNGTILAILNLYVAPMPPNSFWLNPTYSLGDVI